MRALQMTEARCQWGWRGQQRQRVLHHTAQQRKERQQQQLEHQPNGGRLRSTRRGGPRTWVWCPGRELGADLAVRSREAQCRGGVSGEVAAGGGGIRICTSLLSGAMAARRGTLRLSAAAAAERGCVCEMRRDRQSGPVAGALVVGGQPSRGTGSKLASPSMRNRRARAPTAGRRRCADEETVVAEVRPVVR